MTRKLAAQIHLYIAMFLAPIMLMIAVSGGLYLFGIKGDVTKTNIPVASNVKLDFSGQNLEQQVKDLLSQANQDDNFEYLKQGGGTIYTRPTSKTSFQISTKNDVIILTKIEPNAVKSIVELHKGHGPLAFKTLQKITAIGLVVLLISGIIMALYNRRSRNTAALTFAAGGFFALLLALL